MRPCRHGIQKMELIIPPDTGGIIRSALLKVVDACTKLPNFDTLQIVHFSLATPPPIRQCWLCGDPGTYTEEQKQVLRNRVRGAMDLAIDCLKKPKVGYQEGVGREKTALKEQRKGVKDRAADGLKSDTGRKKITVRVIELSSVFGPPSPQTGLPSRSSLGSVKVE